MPEFKFVNREPFIWFNPERLEHTPVNAKFRVRPEERQLLRELAKQVAEIGSHPRQAEKREQWKRHNSLRPDKPMVLVFPEGAWAELLPESSLVIEDEFPRGIEWQLRHFIYRWEHLRDDNVIEPHFKLPMVYSSNEWGVRVERIQSTTDRGAWGFDPVIVQPSDFEKMQPVRHEIDEEETQARFEAVSEAIGDILPVQVSRRIWFDTNLIDTFADLRGLEQLMLDMCDRPQWLHEVMEFMTQATLDELDRLEREARMDLNNADDYVGSGGVGYTDELPAPDFGPKPGSPPIGGSRAQNGQGTGAAAPHSPGGLPPGVHVRCRDLWGMSAAQDLAQVSPAMLDEFVLPYQGRMLDRFGLNCYGCCESMNGKLEPAIRRIPRLRRISVSPWTDLREAAETLGDRYIFSWKPNPAEAMLAFDPNRVRRMIQQCLDIAKGCVVEIILKDTHTVEHQPERMETWVRIANELTAG